MIKPQRLLPGDTVAAISPSWGCAGSSRVRWRYELGCERLRELGLNVTAAPNSLKGTTYLRNNPEARADDINWAFENKEIKAVIANIGGNDADMLLPFLSGSAVKDNPKILCGYSDVMAIHLFCFRSGLMTFYGDNLLTDIAGGPLWHPYSRHWFEKVFFDPSAIGRIDPSEEWSYDSMNLTCKDSVKNYIPNPGYFRVQGKGKVRGRLFGGHGELQRIKDGEGEMFLSKDCMKNSIFFFEDIPECCDPEGMASFFDLLGQHGYLHLINGIIIGKMRMKEPFDLYSDALKKIITDKYGLPDLPVLGGLNFGHTSPVCIIPYGAEAEIDMNDLSFGILESGVI